MLNSSHFCVIPPSTTKTSGGKEQRAEGGGKRREAVAGPVGSAAAGAAPKKAKKSKPGSDHGKNKLTPAQRLKIISEIKAGRKRSTVAEEYNIGTSYISKLMKPEAIAALEEARDMELNQDALRVPTPVHTGLEKRLLAWIKIARARFTVRVAI